MVRFGFIKSFEMETLRDGSCSEKTRCSKRSGSHLELCKGEKTVAWISSDCKVHGNQVRQKKKKLLEGLQGIFTDGRKKTDKENEELTAEL